MKKILILILVPVIVGICTASYAETQDLGNMTVEQILTDPTLNSSTKQSLITHISNMKKPSVTQITQEVTDWNQLGKAFADTLKNIAQSLSVEVNEFVKTDVGILVTVLIVYKLIGTDVIQFCISTGTWIILTTFLFIYLKKFHFPVKHVRMDGDNKIVEFKPPYEWESRDFKVASGFISLVLFVIYTITCALNAVP